jgi:hypothetical protein
MSRAGNTASGAVTGAAAGSTFGPIGAGVGGIIGAASGFFGAGKGKKDKFRQINNLNPQQNQQLGNVLDQANASGQAGGNYNLAQQYQNRILQGDQQSFNQWAAPYETQFNEQTLPGIAERFAGLSGAHGNPANYSGFGQAIGGAATQFKSNLAGMYAQIQQQAAQHATGQYNALNSLGLGTQAFQNAYQPGSIGAFGQIASGVGQGVSQGIGQKIGTNFSNMFKTGQTGNTNQEQTQGQTIEDTYGPDAGNGTYNPYTGYQG